MKLVLVFFGFFLTINLFSQKTTFYKDQYCYQETSEKKARFKKNESFIGDTLLIQIRRISNNSLLAESKLVGNKPVGTWTQFNLTGNLVAVRDFEELVYSDAPNEGIFDNQIDNEDYEIASFPTGESGMFQFLGTTIRYPAESREMGNSGTVYLRFIIDKEGNVKPYSILRGADPFLDMEAWQVVEKMPKWNPAKRNGQPIESMMTLPIRFVLR